MASRATIADVARQAGVSVATVDRVLNERRRVKPATAEAVRAAAEEIGFYAAHSADKTRQGAGSGKTAWFCAAETDQRLFIAACRKTSRLRRRLCRTAGPCARPGLSVNLRPLQSSRRCGTWNTRASTQSPRWP